YRASVVTGSCHQDGLSRMHAKGVTAATTQGVSHPTDQFAEAAFRRRRWYSVKQTIGHRKNAATAWECCIPNFAMVDVSDCGGALRACQPHNRTTANGVSGKKMAALQPSQRFHCSQPAL